MRQSIRINILPVVVIPAVILFTVCAYVSALNIAQCNSSSSNNGNYINNTQTNCIYSRIYCDGQNSLYCDQYDQCDPSYNCSNVAVTETTTIRSTTRFSTVTPNPYSVTEPTIVTSTQSSSATVTATATPTATDVRGTCRRGRTEKYKYPDNCNYYFYCLDGFLIVEQCPLGYAYSEERKACLKRTSDFVGC